MSSQEFEPAFAELDHIIEGQKRTWGEERTRNLGATVESLMRRRGFSPEELDQYTQDDFELVA